ncbi:hypothetical protein [Oceaniferula spumae]
MNKLRHSIISLALISSLHAKPATFVEKGGLVVIEAESTSSSLKKWDKKTKVAGYKGECHLEFTGNKPESGPAHSPLKYQFKITKGGNYTLVIRAHKNLVSDRQDICNDCYVRLEGDYQSGNNTPVKILKKDTKMFGGTAKGWGYAVKLDEAHKKYTPVYQLKAGETYTLVISGRSKNFNMDRIMLIHESHKPKKVQASLPEESKKL